MQKKDPATRPAGLARVRASQRRRSEERIERRVTERFSAQLSGHWAQVRAERARAERAHRDTRRLLVEAGESNMSRARVPYGVDLAAAWAWRFLVIVAAGYLLARAVGFLQVLVLPLVVALFIAALVLPLVNLLARALPRGVAAVLVVTGVLGSVSLMLTFATQQIVDGFNDLATQVVDGLEQIRDWLRDGPLNASEAQINDAIEEMQGLVVSGNTQLVSRLTDVGAAVGNVVAGFFIVLFATFFFLNDGRAIWAWLVRLAPRGARTRVDSSGQVAWLSLTQFVRATVLVALVDAAGIMTVAAVLDVPFVFAIGVLVFLGAFIPLVGATVSGIVAVLVALVAQGPVVALLMLAGVVGVQQVEAQILQPFLMGRMVSVHPLAVILAIGAGILVAGIPGALVAVPLAAAANAVVTHLASPEAEAGEIPHELAESPLTEDIESPTRGDA